MALPPRSRDAEEKQRHAESLGELAKNTRPQVYRPVPPLRRGESSLFGGHSHSKIPPSDSLIPPE